MNKKMGMCIIEIVTFKFSGDFFSTAGGEGTQKRMQKL